MAKSPGVEKKKSSTPQSSLEKCVVGVAIDCKKEQVVWIEGGGSWRSQLKYCLLRASSVLSPEVVAANNSGILIARLFASSLKDLDSFGRPEDVLSLTGQIAENLPVESHFVQSLSDRPSLRLALDRVSLGRLEDFLSPEEHDYSSDTNELPWFLRSTPEMCQAELKRKSGLADALELSRHISSKPANKDQMEASEDKKIVAEAIENLEGEDLADIARAIANRFVATNRVNELGDLGFPALEVGKESKSSRQSHPRIKSSSAIAFGKKLSLAREACSLSTRELAAIADIAQPQIVRYENGYSMPNLETRLKLAKALNATF